MQIDLQQFQGIVVSSKANYLNVDINLKEDSDHITFERNTKLIRLLCTSRSKLKYEGFRVNVGDQVIVESIDWKLKKGVICKVNTRFNLLDRPPVSNVTNVVVLLSVSQPEFAFDQASRFLTTAEKLGIKVTLVLTKIDLISCEKLSKLINQLKGWCYQPIPISIQNGEGIELFLTQLKSTRLSVLCGPSGVGKSSLINYILPQLSLLTSPVTTKLRRGRHTTRNVELFSLPNGSLVADTPGFNRPDLDIEPKNIQFLFPELRAQLINNPCKFRDCLHRDEPGCSVSKNWQRYSFYREYLSEMLSLHH